MVFTGYLQVGGREIINVARLDAYASLLLPNLDLRICDGCEDLVEALGHKAYTTPLVDQPSWFDPDNPDSWDLCGLYPLGFEGFEDATMEATVVEFVKDGGVVTGLRRATRSMRITALLIGKTPASVSAGMVWLRNVLIPGRCGSGTAACNGDHMTYFSSCPPMCSDSPDLLLALQDENGPRECSTGAALSPISICTLPYERHLYGVSLVDGPRIVEEYPTECASMVKVEFTLVAGTPSPFGTGTQVIEVTPDLNLLPSFTDVACGDAATSIVQRTNLAPNPRPVLDLGWSSLDTAYWTNTFGTTPVHTAGGRSVTSNRKTVGGWAPAVIGGASFIGAYDVLGSALPQVTAGAIYTASVWVSASVTARGYLEVQGLSGAGSQIGPPVVAVSPEVGANEWVRLSMVYTPPAGVTAVRIAARMEVPAPATAVVGSKVYLTEAMLEPVAVVGAYFDGDFTDTGVAIVYDWLDVRGKSSSRVVQTVAGGVLADPDCPPIPLPPRAPVIDELCVDEISTYKRFTVTIPQEVVPAWADVVPIVNITSTSQPLRQLRARFYSNESNLDPADLVPCSYVGEFIVSYLPENSTMTIDGITQTVTVIGTNGDVQQAAHLLYGSGGGPMVWPAMSCGSRYDLAVDVDPTATGLTFELCVAARE